MLFFLLVAVVGDGWWWVVMVLVVVVVIVVVAPFGVCGDGGVVGKLALNGLLGYRPVASGV